jgi:nicotinate (nicotinamide) nucleotide adenylyltransferase
MNKLFQPYKLKENNSIACLFGSMNPPHIGHLETAARARMVTGASEIWMVPSRHSVFKKNIPQVSHEHKVAMCKIMAEEAGPWLKVSGKLKDQEPTLVSNLTSYFNVVTELNAQYPNRDIFLIHGLDHEEKARQYSPFAKMAFSLHTMIQAWSYVDIVHDDDEIMMSNGRLEFVGLDRSAAPSHEVVGDTPSSCSIRQAIAEGREPKFLTPAVKQYIFENGLYL